VDADCGAAWGRPGPATSRGPAGFADTLSLRGPRPVASVARRAAIRPLPASAILVTCDRERRGPAA